MLHSAQNRRPPVAEYMDTNVLMVAGKQTQLPAPVGCSPQRLKQELFLRCTDGAFLIAVGTDEEKKISERLTSSQALLCCPNPGNQRSPEFLDISPCPICPMNMDMSMGAFNTVLQFDEDN